MINYQKIIPFIVSLAMFMEALDSTILNTAIPAMSASLHVGPVDLKIALISYLLSLAIFIPISGWVADKFGIKRVFIGALILFTVSSAWCGFAHHLSQLIVARTLQGIGGSFTLPVGRLIILRTFERHEFVITFSRMVMVGSMGMMLGPVLGGFITHYFSWHWIFWINLPVGALATIMALYGLKDDPPQSVHPLDVKGFLLFGFGLAGLTLGLSTLSESFIATRISLILLFASIIFLSGYVFYSRHRPYPIVKVSLFQAKTFQISTLGSLCSRIGFGGAPFLLPLLFQVSLNHSAQVSGILMAPIAVGVWLSKIWSMPLLQYWGYRRLLIANTILVGMGLWSFIFINAHTSVYMIALLVFVYGFLLSIQYSAMNSLAFADLPHGDFSAATSATGTIQQLAQSLGVAVSAILIRCFSQTDGSDYILVASVFHKVFFAIGAITILTSLIFMRLNASDGQQMLVGKNA